MTMEELPLKRTKLQQMLQTIVQKFGWTYSLFWKFCPRKGLLAWGDGHYNGSIKTRKTVQAAAVSSEASSVERSGQLKELYEFLAAGGDSSERRRPGLALSPEDLTECEWFYLMCVSFTFAPGSGLPGKAFKRQNHIWLTKANDTSSKVFSRTILAKSAGIQTVVCIPLTNGVLELGTEEMVKEDTRLTQQARIIFADIYINSPIPVLSENFTSSPAFERETLPMIQGMDGLCQACEEEIDNENEDNNNGESAECEIKRAFLESEFENGRNSLEQTNFPGMVVTNMSLAESEHISDLEKSQLKILEVAQRYKNVHSFDQDDNESYLAWYLLHDGPCNDLQHSSDSMEVIELPPEDVHYSETVTTILHNNNNDFLEGSFINQFSYSDSSSFSKWFCENQIFSKTRASQCMLKYILSILPTLHNKKYVNSVHLRGKESGGWKGILQNETNGNHVLAERRRREKLNKRFMVLRALVPCVTKMDKASILADTIDYVKQLTRRICDLESQNKKISNLLGSKVSESHHQINSHDQKLKTNCSMLSTSVTQSKQKITHLLETKKLKTLHSTNDIEEAKKCPYKDGILLKIMQQLDKLNLEITYINSTMDNHNFIAEFKAKVKEPRGKKARVGEIKWAIHQLLSH